MALPPQSLLQAEDAMESQPDQLQQHCRQAKLQKQARQQPAERHPATKELTRQAPPLQPLLAWKPQVWKPHCRGSQRLAKMELED